MSPIKLKPCPFCGGEAKIKTTVDTNRLPIYITAYIRCEECGAYTKDVDDINRDGMNIFTVIEAWNRRVTE